SAGGAAAGVLRALLRAAWLLEAPAGRRRGCRSPRILVAAHRPEHRRACKRALVGIPTACHLRGEPGLLDVLHVRDDGQDPAVPDDGAANLLHHLPAPVPDG